MLLPSNCPQDHSHQPRTMAERWGGDSSQCCRRSRKDRRCSQRRGCVDLAVQPASTTKGSSQQQPQHCITSTRRAARAWGGVDDRRQWRHERRHGTHRAGPRQHQCVESTAPAPTTNRPKSAGTAPNSGELGFPRSGTSAANRANRPGWQSRSAESGACATDGGGQRRRSRTEAAVSGEGGVGVEQGSAR
jgi:hypothetical protein